MSVHRNPKFAVRINPDMPSPPVKELRVFVNGRCGLSFMPAAALADALDSYFKSENIERAYVIYRFNAEDGKKNISFSPSRAFLSLPAGENLGEKFAAAVTKLVDDPERVSTLKSFCCRDRKFYARSWQDMAAGVSSLLKNLGVEVKINPALFVAR